MPFIQKILFYIPTPVLGLLMIVGSAALSVAGLMLVRRYISHEKLKVHNDVTGAIFETFGVMYAVLLAFVVVIVWENYDKSEANVEKEASLIMDLCRDAEGLSGPLRDSACRVLDQYATAVIEDEWKTLRRGQTSSQVSDLMKRIWEVYSEYKPETETQKVFFAESVRKLNELGELRRQRLLDSRAGVHPLLWFVLISGSLATVVFTFFFGAENLKAHMLMTALLAALLGIILLTILLFDYPFTGDVSIRPDAFRQASSVY